MIADHFPITHDHEVIVAHFLKKSIWSWVIVAHMFFLWMIVNVCWSKIVQFSNFWCSDWHKKSTFFIHTFHPGEFTCMNSWFLLWFLKIPAFIMARNDRKRIENDWRSWPWVIVAHIFEAFKKRIVSDRGSHCGKSIVSDCGSWKKWSTPSLHLMRSF